MITTENRGARAEQGSGVHVPIGSADLHPTIILPEEPVIKIRPGASWSADDLGEVWTHRELFYFLVWRDLKVRYRQTALGASWVVLQPVLMTLIFTIFLGRLVQVPSDGVPYSVFAYTGLLLWAFFSNAVASASHSLVASAHMISKVYFARLIIPGAAVAVRLVDFLIASIILVGLLVYYGITPTWNMLMFPALVAQMTLLALGVGIWTSALNVRYRDVGTVLPVLLQLWMFASPIVYPVQLIPERWRLLFFLNPMAGIVEGFRASLFGLAFNWRGLLISGAITLAVLLYSVRTFRRLEESFADVI